MSDNIKLVRVSPYSGAYPEDTTFETEQQPGGEHRPVVKVGESSLPTGAATADNQTSGAQKTQIVANGFQSVLNKTTTPLGANAAWTGTGEDVTEYTVIMVSVYADQISATNGIEFQFSNDDITYRTTDVYTYTNTTTKLYAVQTAGKYFRPKYTNGATPQGTFELFTSFKKSGGVFRSHRLADTLNGQDDVDPVKAVIAAERPGAADVYVNVQATTAGNLKVSVEEVETGVGIGILGFRDENGDYVPVRVDGGSGYLVIMDTPHHKIHEQESFYYHDVITLASAATQDYLITTPNTTKRANFGYQVVGSGVVTVELFEESDRTGTTAQTIFNRDRDSTNPTGVTIHKGVSGGTTDGTRIVWRKDGRTVGGVVGANIGSGQERILKTNTKYIFRVTSGSAGNDIWIELDHYDHAPIA